eukprot:COSAG05_NODE_4214_length_1618_cov_1.329822_2_plen_283_part_00
MRFSHCLSSAPRTVLLLIVAMTLLFTTRGQQDDTTTDDSALTGDELVDIPVQQESRGDTEATSSDREEAADDGWFSTILTVAEKAPDTVTATAGDRIAIEAGVAAAEVVDVDEIETVPADVFAESTIGDDSVLNARTFDNWVEAGVQSGHTVFIRFVSSKQDAAASSDAWESMKERYGHIGPTVDPTVKAIFGDIDMARNSKNDWQSHHVDLESVVADGGCTVWHYNRYTGPTGNHFVASRHHVNGVVGKTCRHVSDPVELERYVLHNIEMSHNRNLWGREL